MPYEYLHRPENQTLVSNGEYLTRGDENTNEVPSLIPPVFQPKMEGDLFTDRPDVKIDLNQEKEAESNAEKIKSSSIEHQSDSKNQSEGRLSDGTLKKMNNQLGANFQDVRIHTDSKAVQMNKSVGSHALTKGKDIYFNQDKFDESTAEGQSLLAHELTHVKQQSGESQTQAQPFIQGIIDYAEDEYEEKKEDVEEYVEDVVETVTDSDAGEFIEDTVDQVEDTVEGGQDALEQAGEDHILSPILNTVENVSNVGSDTVDKAKHKGQELHGKGTAILYKGKYFVGKNSQAIVTKTKNAADNMAWRAKHMVDIGITKTKNMTESGKGFAENFARAGVNKTKHVVQDGIGASSKIIKGIAHTGQSGVKKGVDTAKRFAQFGSDKAGKAVNSGKEKVGQSIQHAGTHWENTKNHFGSAKKVGEENLKHSGREHYQIYKKIIQHMLDVAVRTGQIPEKGNIAPLPTKELLERVLLQDDIVNHYLGSDSEGEEMAKRKKLMEANKKKKAKAKKKAKKKK